jgi:polyisoprenoid-binding protein YceI
MQRISKLYTILVISAVVIFIVGIAGAQDAKKWHTDIAHSKISFTVSHFFTPVEGTFDIFEMDLRFDPDNLDGSSVEVTIPVNSINTRNEKRDNHLMSPDFFNAEKYPNMTFKSSEIMKKGDGYVAKGTLQIKDVAKEIELPFQLLGIKELPEAMSKQMGGIDEVASFHASYTLNRNDYNVGTGSWTATVIVGDEVNIDISLEVDYTKP